MSWKWLVFRWDGFNSSLGKAMFSDGYGKNFAARVFTQKMEAAKNSVELLPLTKASRADIIQVLYKARSALGLSRQQVSLLVFLMHWTREEDWDEGGDPVSVAPNYVIGREFDIKETRIRNLLRGLAEAGWLIHRDSPNGQRRRFHTASGQGYAYGLDLSPLSRRYHELKEAAEAVEERNREGQRLYFEVLRLARRIYGLSERAEAMGMDAQEAQAYGKQAHELSLLRGEERDPFHLSPLCDELSALLNTLEKAVALLQPVDREESAGKPALKCGDYTNTKPSKFNVEKGVRSAHKLHKRKSDESGGIISPLRKFNATPQILLAIAPAFRDFCSSSRPERDEITSAALFVSDSLGISRHAWKQSNGILGQYETAVAIAIIYARKQAGKIRSTGGYLRGMIERQIAGELYLDKTLYGLISSLC